MSPETATTVLETEEDINISDNLQAETINEDDWDKQLTDLVAANADVIIESPWHGGAEMTLSAAILMCQVKITSENVYFFVSEVQRLLANRLIKKEETRSEDELENEAQQADAETENPHEQSDSKPKIVFSLAPDSVETVTPAGDNALPPAGFLESPSEIAPEDGSGILKPLTPPPSTAENSIPEPIATEVMEGFTVVTPEAELDFTQPETKLEIKEKQKSLPAEAPEPITLENSVVPAESSIGHASINESPETKHQAEEIAELPPKAEVKPVPEVELEITAAADDFAELSANAEMTDDEVTFEPLDYMVEESEVAKLAEIEAALADQMEEDALESGELYEFSDLASAETPADSLEVQQEDLSLELNEELSTSKLEDITDSEKTLEISVPRQEVEATLIEVNEKIKISEPETIEKANTILDEVIEIAASFHAEQDENNAVEAEVQEEVEELFTNLLSELGIDYTEELIESLATITLRWDLAHELEELKPEKDADEDQTKHDVGTHEIITKILKALSRLKDALAHANELGRFALQLCSFSFAVTA